MPNLLTLLRLGGLNLNNVDEGEWIPRKWPWSKDIFSVANCKLQKIRALTLILWMLEKNVKNF